MDAHDDLERVRRMLALVGEAPSVVERSSRVMARAGPDDDQQPVVLGLIGLVVMAWVACCYGRARMDIASTGPGIGWSPAAQGSRAKVIPRPRLRSGSGVPRA